MTDTYVLTQPAVARLAQLVKADQGKSDQAVRVVAAKKPPRNDAVAQVIFVESGIYPKVEARRCGDDYILTAYAV